MSVFGKKLFIQFAICGALCIGGRSGMKIQTFSRDFGTSVYQQDQSSLTSPGQVYGDCDDPPLDGSQKKFETTCKFAMEMADVAIESPDHIRRCNFTLSKDEPLTDKIYMLDEIVAITKDRAVVRFRGYTSQMIFVLNFADCTVSNSHTSDKVMSIHAPTYGKFDVISSKPQHADKKYRAVFDTDGNIISDEQLWFQSDSYSSIISVVNSPVKGRLVIDVIGKSINESSGAVVRVSAVDENGSFDNLKEYPIDNVVDGTRSDRFVVSTTFDFVSLCARLQEAETINCAQFDLGGNIKFENAISLREYSLVHSMALHNLPRGGFLLFINKCQESERVRCIFKKQSSHVKKISASGKLVATMRINEHNSNSVSITPGKMHLFKSDKSGICLSNVRSKSNDWNIILDVVCLKSDDFSGEIDWPSY